MTRAIVVERDLMVPMRDGVALATDVYRPRDATEAPVLVQRTPYDKGAPASRDFALDVLRATRMPATPWSSRTRAAATALRRVPPVRRTRPADGAATVAWAARRPWSSGAVGMIGSSYCGAAQWQAAAAAPAAARGDRADDHRCGLPGRMDAPGRRVPARLLPALDALPTSPWARSPCRRRDAGDALAALVAAVDDTCALVPTGIPWRGPCRLLDALAPYHRHVVRAPFPRRLSARGRAPRARYAAIAAPALIIGGWYDTFLGGTLADYAGMRRHGATAAARRPPRLRHRAVGPREPLRVVPGARLSGSPSASTRVETTALQLRWFDRHLRGARRRRATTSRRSGLYVMGADEWRDERDWPLPGTDYTRFYLPQRRAREHRVRRRRAQHRRAGRRAATTVSATTPATPSRPLGGATFLPGLERQRERGTP